MNDTVNSGISENGQAALDRVQAMLEAVSGKPVNIVTVGDQDTDEGEVDRFESFEPQIRPVVRPLVLSAIAALEEAKAHCEKVLRDAVGAPEDVGDVDLPSSVFEVDHEISGLASLIKLLSYAADGFEGEMRMNADAQAGSQF